MRAACVEMRTNSNECSIHLPSALQVERHHKVPTKFKSISQRNMAYSIVADVIDHEIFKSRVLIILIILDDVAQLLALIVLAKSPQEELNYRLQWQRTYGGKCT